MSIVNKYEQLIKETAIYPREIGIAYTALGLAGEAGEIANKVKKLYRDKNLLNVDLENGYKGWGSLDVSSKDIIISTEKDNIKAELGDVLWYVVALAQEFDLSLEEIMQHNIEKLLGRRERGTLQGSGDNR